MGASERTGAALPEASTSTAGRDLGKYSAYNSRSLEIRGAHRVSRPNSRSIASRRRKVRDRRGHYYRAGRSPQLCALCT
jgi:hypothetical protein